MHLTEAREIADALKGAMAPYCAKIEVAGSIRRRKAENVKDVEIVALPQWEGSHNRLYAWAISDDALLDTPLATWIKPGAKPVPWDVSEEGRYWRGLLINGAKLDVFLPVPDGWGAQFLIRTGVAEFGAAVLGHAKRVGHQFQEGVLLDMSGNTVPCPDEETVFRVLGLAYVPPHLRTGKDAVRRIR